MRCCGWRTKASASRPATPSACSISSCRAIGRAPALASEAQPDVALIDIGLPDIDGYEVARQLRARHTGRRMGLVAVTGFGQPEDQRRAMDAGFDAHLVKPVKPERLKQVLEEL